MADLDTAGAVTLGLAMLAGVVAAVEKISDMRRDWRGRPMPPKKSTAEASDSTPPSSESAPVTRRGRPSLTTLSEQMPVTRAEFEARVHAIHEDLIEIKADIRRLDDWRDRFEVEVVRGVGGINTRLETLRGHIAGLREALAPVGRGRR